MNQDIIQPQRRAGAGYARDLDLLTLAALTGAGLSVGGCVPYCVDNGDGTMDCLIG